jgi:hypothetical protein
VVFSLTSKEHCDWQFINAALLGNILITLPGSISWRNISLLPLTFSLFYLKKEKLSL